ncbi:WG repeat-containing protein [Flavobacterium psychrophilum]|uniref:WG repeat-containing protein n=2 Tax=Flavobacterium psychrophilum TaxID=96345 RepID=UPI000E3CCD76|nr:WG repeat-containing protein [Flavobacterium psychrophilum]EKT4526205.1 WG repeat-containing protein [Flavobacterium psychrophilum]EKT4534181.1 WG repeat-containing protein [Flavobacterium psychrophilum]EKT4536244.1 WG repeat-containing protein [Flavobacterium psychrophilum]EKT4544411.1 WG repeat-containing protein [Flavobacterium psychrophilum]
MSNLQFTDISNFTNNKAIVTFQNKLTSIIDNTGNIILKTIKDFSFEKVLNDDIYLVKNNLNAKKGVINLKGELIIKSKYNEIEQVKSFFIAKINNKKVLFH